MLALTCCFWNLASTVQKVWAGLLGDETNGPGVCLALIVGWPVAGHVNDFTYSGAECTAN